MSLPCDSYPLPFSKDDRAFLSFCHSMYFRLRTREAL